MTNTSRAGLTILPNAYASLIGIGNCHNVFSVIASENDAIRGADASDLGERRLICFSNTAEGTYRIADAGELSSESSFSQNIASVSFINRACIKVYSSVSGTIRVIGNINSGDDMIFARRHYDKCLQRRLCFVPIRRQMRKLGAKGLHLSGQRRQLRYSARKKRPRSF